MFWIISVFLIIAAVLFFIMYIARGAAFYYPVKKRRSPSPYFGTVNERDRSFIKGLFDEMAALPFEKVSATAYDGLTLNGMYYHISDDAPLQIQFHGYHGSGVRDFSGGNKLARDMGHNTLVIEQRSHGESLDSTVTFGVREKFDCLSWIEYAIERFGKEKSIILAGVSMGAATVLMASALKLPENVKCIIADCPYSSPADIIEKVCRVDMHLPGKLGRFVACATARLMCGFSLKDEGPVFAVKNATVPILIIHGDADAFVPCDMSRKIFAACSSEKKQLEIFEDAGHGLSYIVDDKRYKETVEQFFKEVL